MRGFLIWLLLCSPLWATTYYIRPDGGSRYNATTNPNGQCSGTTNAAYPGTGTNQACGFSDFPYLYTSGGTDTSFSWILGAGDTVILDAQELSGGGGGNYGTYTIGSEPGVGNGSSCGWAGGSGTGSTCSPPAMPSGTSGAHITIEGACAVNGNCLTSDATGQECSHADSPCKAPILTNYSVVLARYLAKSGYMFQLDNTSYVDFKGLDFSPEVGDCIVQLGGTTNPTRPYACSIASPVSDSAYKAFVMSDANGPGPANVTFTWINCHGFAGQCWKGAFSGNLTMDHVWAGYIGNTAPYDMDDGVVHYAPGGNLTVTHTTFEFSGCVQLPATRTATSSGVQFAYAYAVPLDLCVSQDYGGLGDCFGGPNGVQPGTNVWNFDQDILRYCVQDGFDILHTYCPTGQTCSIQQIITRSRIYGNTGNQVKMGRLNGGGVFAENLVVGNCDYMQKPHTGFPPGFNHFIGQSNGFCRADGIAFVKHFAVTEYDIIEHNLIIGHINMGVGFANCTLLYAYATGPSQAGTSTSCGSDASNRAENCPSATTANNNACTAAAVKFLSNIVISYRDYAVPTTINGANWQYACSVNTAAGRCNDPVSTDNTQYVQSVTNSDPSTNYYTQNDGLGDTGSRTNNLYFNGNPSMVYLNCNTAPAANEQCGVDPLWEGEWDIDDVAEHPELWHFQPGSVVFGNGAAPVSSITTDINGVSWGGTYNIGPFKQ